MKAYITKAMQKELIEKETISDFTMWLRIPKGHSQSEFVEITLPDPSKKGV